MPSELEYPEAYYSANGKRYPISAADLGNKETLELAKTVFLTDKSDQVRLRPRVPKDKRSHFYAPDSTSQRGVSEGEDDPAHNDRVRKLLDKLTHQTIWKVVIGRFVDGVLEREPRFQLEDYLWGKEIHRICSSELVIRHDLFGQSRLPAMSIFRPWVAIEVVNTHFPDEPAFKAMLDLSRQMPLLVLFDVLRERIFSYFLKVDDQKGEITPLYYIYEGCVWKGDKQRKEIGSATRLAIEVEADVKRLHAQKKP